MAKLSQVKSHRKIVNPVFHLQSKDEDDGKLSAVLLKNTRKTGQLNLSNRSLKKIPEKLWTIYEPTKEETSVSYDFCKEDDESWWIYQPLNNLNLSSNFLDSIPKRIEIFQDLVTLNLQDNKIISLPNELSKLTKLTKLNLSHNQLTAIPDCVYKLIELQTLVMSHNNIENVKMDIGDLIMLQYLDLSNNNLINLPPDIGFLVRLTELNLSHNKLIEIPASLVNLRVLLKLDLTYNELVLLPPLGELRKLQILYANHNNIEIIPDCTGCESLQEIHFGNNYITEITQEFCETIASLKILDLRDNKIEYLPKEIAFLQKLIRLDLTNNSLTDIPNSLRKLAYLQSLQIDGNKIRSIRRDVMQRGTSAILKFLKERQQTSLDNDNDSNISDSSSTIKCQISPIHSFPDRFAMRNVKSLNLMMLDLNTIPDEVIKDAEIAEVTNVDICKNKLSQISNNFASLSRNVMEINASYNVLNSIPDFIASFTKLYYLNISCNVISDLPDSLGELKNMRELVISNNKFTTIPQCVYKMTNLEIFMASDNKIVKIDVENLANNKRLAILNLTNNNIDFIPPELGNLTQIRSLEINGNTFRNPRFAILSKGTDAIMAYLRDRIHNAQ